MLRLRGIGAALFLLLAAFIPWQPVVAQVRQLSELSVTDIQALDRNNTVVIIPGGVMEEPGPYLPVFTSGCSGKALAARTPDRHANDGKHAMPAACPDLHSRCEHGPWRRVEQQAEPEHRGDRRHSVYPIRPSPA